MNDITRVLHSIENGNTAAAEDLIPLAYRELKRIAASKLASERSGHILQPTALVHEAWMRLKGPDGKDPGWNSRAHFFAAAAEAMRRILIESARRKMSIKRGENPQVTSLDEEHFEAEERPDRIIAVDEALTRLEDVNPDFAKVVKFRYFAGLTVPEAAVALGISESSVNRIWKSAKAWLYREIDKE